MHRKSRKGGRGEGRATCTLGENDFAPRLPGASLPASFPSETERNKINGHNFFWLEWPRKTKPLGKRGVKNNHGVIVLKD